MEQLHHTQPDLWERESSERGTEGWGEGWSRVRRCGVKMAPRNVLFHHSQLNLRGQGESLAEAWCSERPG